MAPQQQRVGFIGAGRVATSLAPALREAGWRVTAVASRSFASADRLAARLPGCVAYETLQAAVEDVDLVFLTTPDAALRAVAESLRWRPSVAVVHTSGAESRDILQVAATAGAETGSLHPLQTFAGAPTSLRGCFFGVEADGQLRTTLLAMVESLGGTAIEVQSRDKALYHAAAVLASNYVVTLMQQASSLWTCFGVEREAAVQALLPLLKGTAANLETLGLPGALTGPIARGDVATVRRHLQELSERAPEVVATYRQLGLETIALAREQGGLSETAAGELRQLLDDCGPCKEKTP